MLKCDCHLIYKLLLFIYIVNEENKTVPEKNNEK